MKYFLSVIVVSLSSLVAVVWAEAPFVLGSGGSAIEDEGLVVEKEGGGNEHTIAVERVLVEDGNSDSSLVLPEESSIPVLETEYCKPFVEFMHQENDRLVFLNDETIIRFVCHAFQRKILENTLKRMEGNLRGTRKKQRLLLEQQAEEEEGENGIVAYHDASGSPAEPATTNRRHLLGEGLPKECVKAYEHRIVSQREKLFEIVRSGKKCKEEVRLELQNFRHQPRIGTSPFLDAYTGADVLP